MKKPLSLYEQVQAAKQNVNSWPESVKSATEIRFSDFFPAEKKREIESEHSHTHSEDKFAKA